MEIITDRHCVHHYPTLVVIKLLITGHLPQRYLRLLAIFHIIDAVYIASGRPKTQCHLLVRIWLWRNPEILVLICKQRRPVYHFQYFWFHSMFILTFYFTFGGHSTIKNPSLQASLHRTSDLLTPLIPDCSALRGIIYILSNFCLEYKHNSPLQLFSPYFGTANGYCTRVGIFWTENAV